LFSYEDGDSLYYIEQINQLAITEKLTVYIQFNHIMNVNSELATAIASNYYR
jgi:DNA replicative helicase MCM subunit Mcm2 (Cdc46/Mcm family)